MIGTAGFLYDSYLQFKALGPHLHSYNPGNGREKYFKRKPKMPIKLRDPLFKTRTWSKVQLSFLYSEINTGR